MENLKAFFMRTPVRAMWHAVFNGIFCDELIFL